SMAWVCGVRADSVSTSTGWGSVLAIAGFELGRLAVQLAALPGPVGDPVDLPRQRDTRVAEQALGLAGVHDPGGRGLLARDDGRLVQASRELFGKPAYG